MFNKLKHLKDLKNQAKTLENALAEESVTVERGGIILVMDGNQKIKSLTINSELDAGTIQELIPPLVNEANEKIKKIMAQTFQSMGGLNLPGM